MSDDDSIPPTARKFGHALEKWLGKSGYDVPVEWDADEGHVVIGRLKRVDANRLKDEGGFDELMVESMSAVEEWKRIWADEPDFRKSSGALQDDLIRFFGPAPWQPSAHSVHKDAVGPKMGITGRVPSCGRCHTTMIPGRARQAGPQLGEGMKWLDEDVERLVVLSADDRIVSDGRVGLEIRGFRCPVCGVIEFYAL